ncbi:MAG: hypothetical protein LJE65_01140, partial [Desulfobacteraceae bacterium]|nr:hypothetical protein [Desulfobacteraceae bacterium]
MESYRTDAARRKWDRVRQAAGIFLGFFLFTSPFPRITSIKEIFFYAGVAMFGVITVGTKRSISFRTPLSLPLLLLLGWAFAGVFLSLDVENSLHDWYSHLVKYLLLYFALIH